MKILLAIISVCLLINYAHTICSSSYGAKPCPYVPSPPGKKPPCAKYGDTFCEYPEHYPKDLVYDLVDKWKYDHKTLLLDEDKHDYSNTYFMASDTIPIQYGPPPNTIQNTNNQHQDPNYASYPYPNPVYGPPTRINPNVNTYLPPPATTTINKTRPYHVNRPQYVPSNKFGQFNQQFHYKPKQPSYQTTSNSYYGQTGFNNGYNTEIYQSGVSQNFEGYQYNPWIKWNGRSDKLYIRRRRELIRNNNKWVSVFNETTTLHHERNKRQTTTTANGGVISGQTLCQARSQYIMPRAALNSKGDWMYVVNLPEVDQRYTQLVKSEVCASQQCSGLCSLPNGYTSRCEQKYVQKRLVAVEPGGSQLYSDVFWFPSCCICTITNN